MTQKIAIVLLLVCFVTIYNQLAVSADESVAAAADTVDAGVADHVKGSTDSQTNEKEEGAGNQDGFSADELKAMKQGQESHEFQAEVSRLMDIIINSLYSNREIFLRELISNASDALDKIRFQSLKDKSLLGDVPELEIKIKFDKEAKTLSIRDTGVGMTKEELVQHLGVVASTGTTKFLEAAKSGQDNALQLIGQFGVGFYSVYLVADRVTVVSKSPESAKQYIWQSEAKQTFTVAEDPRGNTLGRGTEIILHLKDDATEYLDASTLEKLVEKYSQFINFPIYIWETKTVSKEVPVEEEEAEASESAEKDGEDVQVSEDEDPLAKEDKKDDKPKTKTVEEEVSDWKQLNENKAIWTRSAKEVEKKEYEEFYKVLTKDHSGPLTHTHFSAEGEIAFKAILYVPENAPSDLYDKYYGKSNALKLYVRRVLISDEFEDLMPRYLNFIKGVVDSDDLPLNVSRETLSKSRVLKVMSKKLTRKALDMLRKMADAQADAMEEQEKADRGELEEDDDDSEPEAAETPESSEGDDKTAEEKAADKKKEKEERAKKRREKRMKKYFSFWKQYSKSIKLGCIEDSSNKSKLQKLLRFRTTKSDESRPISLQQYIDRMQEGQEHIYYITGESYKSVANSPFLEQLKKRDYEVIFMTDPLDEYLMSNMQDFDGKKFMSATKEGLKLGGEDSDFEKRREKAMKEHYEDLCTWLGELYGQKVEKVTVSNRVVDSPAILVTSQWGWSANMERIMKAQTFADNERQQYMMSKKTMEINTRHPIVRELRERSKNNPDDQSTKDLANLMFDSALLQSGFTMENTDDFSQRIERVLKVGLSLDPSTPVAEDDDFEIPEKEEPSETTEDDIEDLDEDDADADADDEAEEPAKDEL